MLNLVLLGPPGAGKGTQAQKLINDFKLVQISTGDLLREHQAKGTALGKEAAGYMNVGKLVPDEVVIGIVEDRLNQPDAKDGFILDGFPRTGAQAEALTPMLKKHGLALNQVFVFDVKNRAALLERITGRRTCPVCKTVYHVKTKPPKVDEKCDNDGATLDLRADDKPEKLNKRLSEFDANSVSVITYYKRQNLLTELNGEESPDVIYAKLKKALGK
jgi:adenylate kinase